MRPAKKRSTAAAKPKQVVNVFPAEETAKIVAAVAAVGPGARLKLRDDGVKMFASVLPPKGTVTTQADTLQEFNNAIRCPPLPPQSCVG